MLRVTKCAIEKCLRELTSLLPNLYNCVVLRSQESSIIWKKHPKNWEKVSHHLAIISNTCWTKRKKERQKEKGKRTYKKNIKTYPSIPSLFWLSKRVPQICMGLFQLGMYHIFRAFELTLCRLQLPLRCVMVGQLFGQVAVSRWTSPSVAYKCTFIFLFLGLVPKLVRNLELVLQWKIRIANIIHPPRKGSILFIQVSTLQLNCIAVGSLDRHEKLEVLDWIKENN